jgi:hypothetical protein
LPYEACDVRRPLFKPRRRPVVIFLQLSSGMLKGVAVMIKLAQHEAVLRCIKYLRTLTMASFASKTSETASNCRHTIRSIRVFASQPRNIESRNELSEAVEWESARRTSFWSVVRTQTWGNKAARALEFGPRKLSSASWVAGPMLVARQLMIVRVVKRLMIRGLSVSCHHSSRDAVVKKS